MVIVTAVHLQIFYSQVDLLSINGYVKKVPKRGKPKNS